MILDYKLVSYLLLQYGCTPQSIYHGNYVGCILCINEHVVSCDAHIIISSLSLPHFSIFLSFFATSNSLSYCIFPLVHCISLLLTNFMNLRLSILLSFSLAQKYPDNHCLTQSAGLKFELLGKMTGNMTISPVKCFVHCLGAKTSILQVIAHANQRGELNLLN